MKNTTCTECTSAVSARGLCVRHYGRLYRSGQLELLPKDPTHHRLSEVDLENKVGVCSICGPTSIRVRGDGRGHQCGTLRRLDRDRPRRANARHSRKTPEQSRRWMLQYRYGISDEQYEDMLERQCGRCAICGISPEGKLAVDHDHSTGKVRALLCRGCNTALGHMREDKKALAAAVDYLSEHE